MNKLSRVLLALALLLFVVAPLAAAQTMNVSWQWLLNDSEVTHYRYQLNGTEDGAWTVLDGKTDTVTLTGLDPYKDYTLYLQCSYDGENWSESASSTAKAMLEAPAVVEETPAASEEVTVEPVAAVATEAASSEVVVAPVAESSSAAAVEAPASRTPYNFTVVDVEVSGEYGDKYFDSYIGLKGIVSSSDIQEFVAYEAAKYGDMLNGIVYEIVEDGIVLTIPEGIDAGLYLDSYKADIVEFLAFVFAPVETPAVAVEPEVAAPAEEEVVAEAAKAYSFKVFSCRVSGEYGDGYFTSTSEKKGLVTADDIMGFAQHENNKYGALLSDVVITVVEDGFELSIPAGVDASGYIDTYKADIIEYVFSLATEETPVVEEVIETAPAATVEVVATVETEATAEPEAPVAVEAPVAEPEPVAVPGAVGGVTAVIVGDDGTGKEAAPAEATSAPVSEAAPVAPVEAKTKAGNKVKVSVAPSVSYAISTAFGQDILAGGRLEVQLTKSFAIGAKVAHGLRPAYMDNSLLAEGYFKFKVPNKNIAFHVGGGLWDNSISVEAGASVDMPLNEYFALFGEAAVIVSMDHINLPTTTLTVGGKYTF